MIPLRPHTLPPPVGLYPARSAIDVGPGIRPCPWFPGASVLCLEPYAGYCSVLRDHGYLVRHIAGFEGLKIISADVVVMLDVIEHMEKWDAQHTITRAQESARRQVVLYTPLGFVEQTQDAWELGGDHWQTHRSGWHPEDFPGWITQLYQPDVTKPPEGFYAIWNRP